MADGENTGFIGKGSYDGDDPPASVEDETTVARDDKVSDTEQSGLADFTGENRGSESEDSLAEVAESVEMKNMTDEQAAEMQEFLKNDFADQFNDQQVAEAILDDLERIEVNEELNAHATAFSSTAITVQPAVVEDGVMDSTLNHELTHTMVAAYGFTNQKGNGEAHNYDGSVLDAFTQDGNSKEDYMLRPADPDEGTIPTDTTPVDFEGDVARGEEVVFEEQDGMRRAVVTGWEDHGSLEQEAGATPGVLGQARDGGKVVSVHHFATVNREGEDRIDAEDIDIGDTVHVYNPTLGDYHGTVTAVDDGFRVEHPDAGVGLQITEDDMEETAVYAVDELPNTPEGNGDEELIPGVRRAREMSAPVTKTADWDTSITVNDLEEGDRIKGTDSFGEEVVGEVIGTEESIMGNTKVEVSPESGQLTKKIEPGRFDAEIQGVEDTSGRPPAGETPSEKVERFVGETNAAWSKMVTDHHHDDRSATIISKNYSTMNANETAAVYHSLMQTDNQSKAEHAATVASQYGGLYDAYTDIFEPSEQVREAINNR